MNWQFLHTGFSTGARNMAVDVELARQAADGGNTFTVRVYGWNPPAISLGWNQSWDEIRMDKVQEAGIEVVRRPTGGRGILHENELTYSVVMRADGANVPSIYNRISLALVAGLQKMGVDATLERSQPHFPSLYRKAESAACFVSSARNEITVGGKKLVGSAQRRYSALNGGEIVLQHGSILLGPEHRRLIDFLVLTPDQRQYLSEQLLSRTTDLHEILRAPVSFDDVARAVRKGFEKVWNIEFDATLSTPIAEHYNVESQI
jgi:lipoate-protein ligase A